MTTTTLIGLYLESAIGVALACVLTTAVARWGGAGVTLAARTWSRLALALVGLGLVAPLGFALLLPRAPAPIEIWGAGGTGPHEGAVVGARRSGHATAAETLSGDRSHALRLGRDVLFAGGLFLGLGMSAGVGRTVWRRRRLGQICRPLPVWKRIGRVRLVVSDDLGSPFAARVDGHAYIVIPSALLVDRQRLRLVIAHEVGHHRAGDLRIAAVVQAVGVLFFWNPLLAWFQRALAELEDLACDRRVLERPAVTPAAYGDALLWAISIVAPPSGDRQIAALGGRAMASGVGSGVGSRDVLRRRFAMMTTETKTKTKTTTTKPARSLVQGPAMMATALAAVTLLASWSVSGAVGERRLSLGEIAALASQIEAREHFPVLVDERVAEAINQRIGTPEARAKLKAAFNRMKPLRPMLDQTFQEQKVPRVLLALALLESGFDNDVKPNRPVERQAAGIWQFLPATARRFGLEISAGKDERLDPTRATAAAAALLRDLHAHFGDWPVAIAAYTGGRATIDKLVAGADREQARRRLLTHDSELGHYLVGAMASIILIENPSLLD